ncbi:MAG: hypothetical protein ACHQ51_15335 [Elusimicrobiota bacterium]
MTGRATEEHPRLKPVRSPWHFTASWLNARFLSWAAGFSIVVLFSALWFMLREKPLPRGGGGFPPPPPV